MQVDLSPPHPPDGTERRGTRARAENVQQRVRYEDHVQPRGEVFFEDAAATEKTQHRRLETKGQEVQVGSVREGGGPPRANVRPPKDSVAPDEIAKQH